MLRISNLGCALLSAFIATPALAHITLEQAEAPVGAPYKAVFKVPHGCDGSTTVKLTVQIPEGVIAVKPMVKAGWEIETKRGAYARSYSYFHGAKFDQGVTQVTWSGGKLPDASAAPSDALAATTPPDPSQINAMVDGLAARLAAQGGSIEEWTRLVRSRLVQGRASDAQAAYDAARKAYPNAADRDELDTLALSSGLVAK